MKSIKKINKKIIVFFLLITVVTGNIVVFANNDKKDKVSSGDPNENMSSLPPETMTTNVTGAVYDEEWGQMKQKIDAKTNENRQKRLRKQDQYNYSKKDIEELFLKGASIEDIYLSDQLGNEWLVDPKELIKEKQEQKDSWESIEAKVKKDKEVKLAARPVTIHRFDIHSITRIDGGRVVDVDVTVECSSGTYIRALARDLGIALGVGGHLTALRRTQVGPYTIEQARTLEELAGELEVLDMSLAARSLMPNRELSDEETTEISFGRRIAAGPGAGTPAAATAENPAAAFAPSGELVALLADTGSFAKPVLVFAPGTGTGTVTVGEDK